MFTDLKWLIRWVMENDPDRIYTALVIVALMVMYIIVKLVYRKRG